MENILISSCLLGEKCRYNGKLYKRHFDDDILNVIKNVYNIISVCPEKLGGLPVPRVCSEIVNGDGIDVLKKKSKVVDSMGNDLTNLFINGANKVYEISKKFNVVGFVCVNKSPSCSANFIYDGNFDKNLIKGIGVATALLKLKSNLPIIDSEEVKKAIMDNEKIIF